MATYFTLSELLRSDTAAARSIDNAPSHDVIRRLNALMDECLDPVRELWGKPIGVNSGYRSPALNAAVRTHRSQRDPLRPAHRRESGPLDPYFIPCRREEPKAGVASVRNEGSCQELFDNRPELEYAL